MKESTPAPTMLTSDKTIGEIVADDYRTAKVFENHGIDFCCGGKVTLGAACTEKGIARILSLGQYLSAGSRNSFSCAQSGLFDQWADRSETTLTWQLIG
jgi:iron-sulfur cluster repair protein YtfE (RIC family)